jgi:hypothetical protein
MNCIFCNKLTILDAGFIDWYSCKDCSASFHVDINNFLVGWQFAKNINNLKVIITNWFPNNCIIININCNITKISQNIKLTPFNLEKLLPLLKTFT